MFPGLFAYYHPMARSCCARLCRDVVIDDGRRYLERSREQYDVVTIDPPPPVEAAGTSLLYSKEFYSVISQRLASGRHSAAMAAPRRRSGPGRRSSRRERVICLRSRFSFVSTTGAFIFWRSNQPIVPRTAHESSGPNAGQGGCRFRRWGPEPLPAGQFGSVLSRELSLDQVISGAPKVRALEDDRPENEYYILRERLPERWLSRIGNPPLDPCTDRAKLL